MPITTTFTSADYWETTLAILKEHFADYLPGVTITDEPPSLESITKPITWIQSLPASENITPRTRRGGKTLQQKRLYFAVSIATTLGTGGQAKLRDLAVAIERSAILADGWKLGQAGLRELEITPFFDVGVESQARIWRKTATLSLVVYVEAT